MLKLLNIMRKIKMGKFRNNESGFSAIEVLLVLFAVGLISGVGYFVYKQNHKPAAPSAATTKSTTTETPKEAIPHAPVFNKLPEGWDEYKSDTNGIRLGYPKVWGTLDPIQLHTPEYTDNTKNMQGLFSIAISKKDDFTVAARKYGATIKPSSDGKSWVVAEENPANVDKYKVGDTYKTTEVKVNGGVAIDLTFEDEDCTHTRWLFTLKDSYAVVTIPSLCPVDLQPTPVASKTAYAKLASDFLDTVTIY
jgi:hypothetical protein